MKHTAEAFRARPVQRFTAAAAAVILSAGLLFTTRGAAAEQNLLKNPGFEDPAPGTDAPPSWVTRSESVGKAMLTDTEAHGGRNGIAIPAHTSVEQKLSSAPAGAYKAASNSPPLLLSA